MVDQVAADDATTTDSSREVNTAADLARLRNAGKPLTSQELKEINARLKAFEEMAKMEERFKVLEGRKRPRIEASESAILPIDPVARPHSSNRSPGNPSSSQGPRTNMHPSIELDDLDSSSSNTITYHNYKRHRFARGIKVTPSYTLKVSSSLREWGNWKKDIERVFEGDPYTYQTGSQKILKALDYIDSSLKTL